MAVLWLLVLLMSVAGRGTRPPIANLRMDPETRRLTWDLRAAVSEVNCDTHDGQFQQAQEDTYCSFEELLLLCEVTNYTVSVKEPPFSASILFPEPVENPQAGAAGLGCRVHDADVLSCSWAVGRGAPDDVQYRSYWRGLSTEYSECEHYVSGPGGVHTGCWTRGLARFSEVAILLVNGTSRRASVPCREHVAHLGIIEQLTTPNVTAKCNKTHSRMEWRAPVSHFNEQFEYELEIQKGAGTDVRKEKVRTNSFELLHPGTYTVKIRAKSESRGTESAWSAGQHFVCDPDEAQHTRVWWTSALVALGTLVAALGTLLLCKRFSLLRKFFPPIPEVKDPNPDHLQNDALMSWEAGGPEDCPVAEVQVLET